MSLPTFHFDTLGYDLKPHHPVVMKLTLLHFLPVEVQDEGQVVVQIKLLKREGHGTKQKSVPFMQKRSFIIYRAAQLLVH